MFSKLSSELEFCVRISTREGSGRNSHAKTKIQFVIQNECRAGQHTAQFIVQNKFKVD